MSQVIRKQIMGKIRRTWISKEDQDVLNKTGIYYIPSMPRWSVFILCTWSCIFLVCIGFEPLKNTAPRVRMVRGGPQGACRTSKLPSMDCLHGPRRGTMQIRVYYTSNELCYCVRIECEDYRTDIGK